MLRANLLEASAGSARRRAGLVAAPRVSRAYSWGLVVVKVLWITERFPPDRGGVAASAARQVEALCQHGADVDVLRLAEDLPAGFVASQRVRSAWLHRVGASARADESLQILAQAAENRLVVDRHAVVHGFGAVHAGYIAAMLGRQRGVPSVVSLRGNDLDRAMFHGPRLPFLLWTLQHASAIAAVTGELLAKAVALSGREHGHHVIHNGVDSERFRPPAPGESPPAEIAARSRPWLAFSGEARLKKGLALLVDLAGRLAQRRAGTLFLCGGVRADEREAFDGLLEQAPAAARALCELPYERDPELLAARYRHMDLCVFPSLWDGLPNALLEAMASARPVIGAAVGGIAEVIEHERSGVLVPLPQLDRFSDRALELLDRSEAQRAALGAAARERVRSCYSPQDEPRLLLDLYRLLGA